MITISKTHWSQKNEVGLLLGGANYFGDIGFKIADLSADASLLPLAKQNAEEIIDNNPDLGQKIVNNWLPKGNEFSLA